MCTLSNIVFYWDVAFFSKCQSVMYEDKEALLTPPILYMIMWRWLKHSVASYRKPEQQWETSFRAENSYMIVTTTCPKGCETTMSLRRTDSFTTLHKASEEAGNGFCSWPVSLCLSSFLSCFGCIHSFAKEAQPIFTFILSGLRAVLCISFCLHQLKGKPGSFSLAHYFQTSFLWT